MARGSQVFLCPVLNESSDVAALLQAIADRLIPGIPSSLRITVVSQIVEDSPPDKDTRTVLEHVLAGMSNSNTQLRSRSVSLPLA